MNIPSNITKEHLLKAIEKIDKEGIPSTADSKYYDVVFNSKKYPPKLIVSYANIYANGSEIDRNSFRGGKDEECFKLLEKNDFEIIPKGEGQYFDELLKFISVANEQTVGSCTTDSARIFIQNTYQQYKGFKVDISFGIGRASRIPWISFLGEKQTTSNGIYPVILYYLSQKLLILAYGISEKNTPRLAWNLPIAQTIKQYFESNNLGVPEKYGSSYVFKAYNLSKASLNKDETEKDLSEILKQYDKVLLNENVSLQAQKQHIPFDYLHYFENVNKSGIYLSDALIQRFSASLICKPFLILTGLSGSGKTKLAQSFVQWICEDKSQYRIIPVGADWTNREPLLGYPNALKPEEYVKPDSGVLDLIIDANKHPELPHFLILDEMNLSHVERYFADFLSVMESKEEIPLHSGEFKNGIPATLKIPSNLFIVGTVNIDETTNMFSPKVLDRANTIEFRVTKDEMQNFLSNIKEINMDVLTGKGAGMAKSFLDMAAIKDFATDANTNAALLKFFGELKKSGAEFGYRSATEILRLIHQLTLLDANMSDEQKIDIAIMQKLLPKLHGSRRKLCPVLETLASFCITGDIKIVKDVFEKDDFDFNSTQVMYPLSLEKIARMYRGAIDNGFASFAEA